MFEGLGNLAGMLKQVRNMQANLQQMQEKLATAEFEGGSGGGMVTAVVNGRGELVRVRIDPQAVNPNDVEMLEDLVKAAVDAAQQKAREAMKAEVASLTGGMQVPGLTDLLGAGPGQ